MYSGLTRGYEIHRPISENAEKESVFELWVHLFTFWQMSVVRFFRIMPLSDSSAVSCSLGVCNFRRAHRVSGESAAITETHWSERFSFVVGFIRRICRSRLDCNSPVASLCSFLVKWCQAALCDGYRLHLLRGYPASGTSVLSGTIAKLSMGIRIRVRIESSTTSACSLLSAAGQWLRSRRAT